MNEQSLQDYISLNRAGRRTLKFVAELREHEKRLYPSGPCGQFSAGIALPGCQSEFDLPATARESLLRIMAARGIPACEKGIPLLLQRDPALEHEEFILDISPTAVSLSAAEGEGLRRGVYLLEEQLCRPASTTPLQACFHRQAKLHWRISRCFFSPTCRPPHSGDELIDEQDYYPEAYLDRLAHENINGLWITLYLQDMPSRFFPEHGQGVEKRLAKLQATVDKCARYGIKCFVFLAEPKGFSNSSLALPVSDGEHVPAMRGHQYNATHSSFCTSSPEGREYLRESIEYLFSRVHGLGGIINIMCLESSDPCATRMLYEHIGPPCNCPRCSQKSTAELFVDIARLMTEAMRKYEPEAQFAGWFYFACFWKDEPEQQQFMRIAERWPDDLHLMFNFEVGGLSNQLGTDRPVLDYSLSFIGPSELWSEVARRCALPAAKLQVSCSHEDASVPIIPVPDNLYRKYQAIQQTSCRMVMQCWYFGNYPGIMNRAAGRLSVAPLPASEEEFLHELALPEWGTDAPALVSAWQAFGEGYRAFPENLNFKWFGPLHQSIAFPWYLFPVDQPLPPSYIFRENSIGGDRIGECLDYTHTLPEAITLLQQMDKHWHHGLKILLPLREKYLHDQARMADLALAECIGLQIRSSLNLLRFYFLREDMIHHRRSHLPEMRCLVLDEIAATKRMRELCQQDSRLGSHSEAEGYLFFPEQLAAREKLLQELLEQDFPRFSFDLPEIRAYAGENCPGYLCGRTRQDATTYPCGETWFRVYRNQEQLCFEIANGQDDVWLELEPCRLFPILNVRFDHQGRNQVFRPLTLPQYWSAERTRENSLVLTFNLQHFAPFRQYPTAPLRFNLHCGNQHLNPPHPWPGRLLLGSNNPADLSFLHLQP